MVPVGFNGADRAVVKTIDKERINYIKTDHTVLVTFGLSNYLTCGLNQNIRRAAIWR
jgi:hypothetical protein